MLVQYILHIFFVCGTVSDALLGPKITTLVFLIYGSLNITSFTSSLVPLFFQKLMVSLQNVLKDD